MNTSDKAMLFAIELVRLEIANLPLALASNAARSAQAAPRRSGRDPMSLLSYNPDGTGGFAIPGSPSNPLNVPRGPRASRASQLADEANQLAVKGLQPLTAASSTLGSAFGRMLGPLGMFTTYLSSGASGAQVFSGAMELFANSFAPVVLPALFTFSVGLVAGADTINRKLLPAMNDFSKWVMSTGLPAMEALASAAGKAAGALTWLANSGPGKLASTNATGPMGQLSALDRWADRISGNGDGVGNNRDDKRGGTALGLSMGDIKEFNRGFMDVLRLSPAGGESLAEGYNKITQKGGHFLGKNLFGSSLSREDYDNNSGAGTGAKGSDPAADATAKARQMVMQQLQFQMGGRASIGSVTGNWARAQMAALSQSPFERESLDLQRKQLAELMKANGELSTGSYTAAPTPEKK